MPPATSKVGGKELRASNVFKSRVCLHYIHFPAGRVGQLLELLKVHLLALLITQFVRESEVAQVWSLRPLRPRAQ